MKCQDLFPLKNKKKIIKQKLSSAAVVIGALRVKKGLFLQESRAIKVVSLEQIVAHPRSASSPLKFTANGMDRTLGQLIPLTAAAATLRSLRNLFLGTMFLISRTTQIYDNVIIVTALSIFTNLCANSAYDTFFLTFFPPENKLWYLMQTVPQRDNLYELVKAYIQRKK